MIHKVDTIGKIGISVSFIKGENLFYLNTNELSSLYTSADGSEITFNSNFNMALSDATNNNLISFNGMGASADIFFETPYKSKLGKKSILTVSANNIGFIHCDAQGAENFIFSKGVEMIKKNRPVILFEDNELHGRYHFDNVCKSYPQYNEESKFNLKKYCMEELKYSTCIDKFNNSIDVLLIP
jgi:hypothetical protein